MFRCPATISANPVSRSNRSRMQMRVLGEGLAFFILTHTNCDTTLEGYRCRAPGKRSALPLLVSGSER